MARRKKKKKKVPKPRYVWKINPKSRVKKSKKTYKRKTDQKSWLDDIGFFFDEA